MAVAVALVLATKELIMCVMGRVFKAQANLFSVGDRIEINGIRGDVIDKGILGTKILEVGPGNITHQYTGRSIVIPNSLFLSNVTMNESFLEDYVLHNFVVPLHRNDDWKKAEKIILELAEKYCSEFYESAERYMAIVRNRENLETPLIKPRVHIQLNGPNDLALITRVTVPAREKGKVEQLIIKGFLDLYNS